MTKTLVKEPKSIPNPDDPTLEAWEKRGFWLKADRFRMDWAWAEKMGARMHVAVLSDDWEGVLATAAALAEKLSGVMEAKRASQAHPWGGAMVKLHEA